MINLISSSRPTIKDIAKETGFSISTVHRALENKEGINPETASIIREAAERNGYIANFSAAAIRRRPYVIAIVLPDSKTYGKYYFSYINNGWHEYYKNFCQSLNISVMEILFDCNIGNDEEKQLEALRNLYRDHSGKIDGLLTCPVSNSDELGMMIERFSLTGTKVVLLENDLPNSGRICCINPSSLQIGRLAAEVMSYGIKKDNGEILIAMGSKNSITHSNNALGFEEYFKAVKPGFKIVHCEYDPDKDRYRQQMKEIIISHKDIVGAYAVRAQASLPMCEEIIASPHKNDTFIIASDLFKETADLLRNEQINAIIYKNPYDRGFYGFGILVDMLVKGVVPEDKMYVPVSVVFRNNLSFYDRII